MRVSAINIVLALQGTLAFHINTYVFPRAQNRVSIDSYRFVMSSTAIDSMAVFPLRDSSSSSSSSNRDYNRRDGIVGIAESSSSTASSEDEKKSLPLLAPEDAWISTLDMESFRRDIRAIGARYHTEQGPADIAHLRKLCLWSNICAAVGLITMAGAAFPSRYFALTHSYSSLTSMPMIASLISSGAFGRKLSCCSTQLRIVLGTVSVMALSLWTFSRWAAIAHHCCHGGYNNCYATANHEAVSSAKYANDRFDSPIRRHSRGKYTGPGALRAFHGGTFAVGSLKRRITQWFDWMLPEAWNLEHNKLHHYRLGEEGDPDNVQRNLAFVRTMRAPKAIKYAGVFFLMCTWKWFYYAPNTYKELVIARMHRRGEEVTEEMQPRREFTLKDMFIKSATHGRTGKTGTIRHQPQRPWRWFTFPDFFCNVIGPYLIGHFLLLPLPLFLPGSILCGFGLSLRWVRNAIILLGVADVATNIQSFIAIMPNHCGDDLYSFGDRSCSPNSGTFYLRQVIGSANFRTGSDINDFLHGWLNYGIEHHLFPQLSALSAKRCQPDVAAVCSAHGVPYVQESVWRRLQKTVAVMVGDADMREYPANWEKDTDLMIWSDQKAKVKSDQGPLAE